MEFHILKNESGEDGTSFRVWVSILFGMSVVVTATILFFTIKFLIIIGFKKKLLTTYLLCLGISAIGRVVAQIVDIAVKWNDGDADLNPGRDTPLNWANAAFFSIAIVINIFNWAYLTLRIEKYRDNKRKSQVPYHIAFITFLIMIGGLYGILVWASGDQSVTNIASYVIGLSYGVTFLLIAIAYLFVSIRLYRSYKNLGPVMARKNLPRLFLGCGVISGSFLSRGIGILILVFSNNFIFLKTLNESIDKWIPPFLIAFIILVDFIPTLYQAFAIQWLINDTKNSKLTQFEGEYQFSDFTDSEFRDSVASGFEQNTKTNLKKDLIQENSDALFSTGKE